MVLVTLFVSTCVVFAILYIVVRTCKPLDERLFYPGKHDMSPTGTIIGRGITFDNETSNLFMCLNTITAGNIHMRFRYQTEKKWIKAAVKLMYEYIGYDGYERYELIYEDKDESFVFWEYTV